MSNITITESDKHYNIGFPFNPFILEQVKLIPGRYFDSGSKMWKVPKHSEKHVHAFANKFKINLNGGQQAPEEVGEIAPLPELTIDIPGLKLQPFAFQKNGIAYILQKKKVIVGDQMGLGKTGEAIVSMAAARPFPCLVICPSSLKLNWQKEINKWTSLKSIILSDNIKNSFLKYYHAGFGDFFIVNFESLKKYFVEKIVDYFHCDQCKKSYETKVCPVHKKALKQSPMRLNHIHFKECVNVFKSVIIDESHRVKSLQAQQTKFTKGICKDKEYILALTGTPVVNKPIDLISQLGIIEHLETSFGGYKKFLDRYCSGMKQASNLKELNYRLNKYCFFRRDKKEVLKDLPDKMRQVVLCEITTQKEYSVAERDLAHYLAEYKKANDAQIKKSMKGEIMVRIGILKNISARGKLHDLYEFIDDIIESGEKLVLFCYLKEIVQLIKNRYPEAVSITGEDSQSDRERAKHEFQKCAVCDVRHEDHKNLDHDHVPSSTSLILMNYKSAGVGHTLTASSRVAFIEYPWTAADCDQCEDRCHRIGQEENLMCTYLMGKDTIDEWMYNDVINGKRQMANTITGATDDVEEEIIDRIANLFNQPK